MTGFRSGTGLTPRPVFLELPEAGSLPTSDRDWTRAATAELLPEQLVLLGFHNGTETLRVVGKPIPASLQIGPNPGATAADQLKADAGGLHVPDALRWTTDFARAVEDGMGFNVDLDQAGIPATFDRLFVLGVRRASTPTKGAAELEELFAHHQASRKGLALLPQGQPTNNTDDRTSGYSWWDDPSVSFDQLFGVAAPEQTDWERRPDGAWLAGALGIDPAVLRQSEHFDSADQSRARALGTVLWPATLGYYLEQQLDPIFSDQTIDETREFFRRFVVGGGALPSIRVGKQPYGVLPVTAWSRSSWWNDRGYDRRAAATGLPSSKYLAGLTGLLGRLRPEWWNLTPGVARVDGPTTDPQQTLLDVLGLHPASVEFAQRFAQSSAQYENLIAFTRASLGTSLSASMALKVADSLTILDSLGWAPAQGEELPRILLKVFRSATNVLGGDLVDALRSETAQLPTVTPDNKNYLQWLAEAARVSHDVLVHQGGFTGDAPTALLYLLVLRALDLGFVDAGNTAQSQAFNWNESQLRELRREPEFLSIAQEGGQPSQWLALHQPLQAVTGDDHIHLSDWLVQSIPTRAPELDAQLTALDRLTSAPTAALERALVAHLDTLSYRFDAWQLGVEAVHLAQLRGDSDSGFSTGGLLLGAYGWVENLQPGAGVETTAELSAEVATAIDAVPGAAVTVPILHDPTNLGHLHAPSLDQAITGAILRNAHGAAATPSDPGALSVDLSSARVRVATRLLEGVRNGQSLGALLGYQLERDLHDRPGLFLDRLLGKLRRAFPLVADHITTTQADDGVDITAIQANQVVDGRAMLDRLDQANTWAYPYGLDLPDPATFSGPGLPSGPEIAAIVDACVQAMRESADAVADLSVAEGLFQVVRGNPDRAAAALDAVSKGTSAPDFEVAATPRSGRTLTHRLALHLDANAVAAGTPRELGEPAVAAWVASIMPDVAQIAAGVSWRSELFGSASTMTATMADLGFAAIDLVWLLDGGGRRDPTP